MGLWGQLGSAIPTLGDQVQGNYTLMSVSSAVQQGCGARQQPPHDPDSTAQLQGAAGVHEAPAHGHKRGPTQHETVALDVMAHANTLPGLHCSRLSRGLFVLLSVLSFSLPSESHSLPNGYLLSWFCSIEVPAD